MAMNGVVRRFATPRRRLIAYLRVLRNPRSPRLRSLREQIEPRLRALVADALGVEPIDLGSETSLIGDLAADSLDVLDVVTRVETLYDIAFPEREIAAIVTYGDLAALTTALVACRMRAHEQPAAAAIELRIGDGQAPSFVRVAGPGAYDQQVLRDDLRRARVDELVTVTRAGTPLPAPVERTLLRARLGGVEVRSDDDAHASAPPSDDRGDASGWSLRRLVETSLDVLGELAAERDASLENLGASRRTLVKVLAGPRATTTDRITVFRAVVETYLDVLEDSRPILHAATQQLGRLDALRRAVDEHAMDVDETRDAYYAIADALLTYVRALQSRMGASRTRLPSRRVSSEDVASGADRTMLRA